VGGLLYAYLYPLSGANEVGRYSWQLVNAIHDEGDGVILCERLSFIRLCLLSLLCYLQIVFVEISLQLHRYLS